MKILYYFQDMFILKMGKQDCSNWKIRNLKYLLNLLSLEKQNLKKLYNFYF